jgi:putative membrane protein
MSWTFEPGPIVALSVLIVAYTLAAVRFRSALVRIGGPPPRWLPSGALTPERPGYLGPWQVVAFFGGVLVAAGALLSPLHELGERYLLSAHMIQHLLLTAVVAPLLLLGTPGWMLRPLWRYAGVRRVAGQILTPVPAFCLYNLVFLAWHAPFIYDLSLRVTLLHVVEHALFLGFALIAWWPVFGPLPEQPRLPHGAQVLYLFFQSLPPTVLGAIIALAEVPLYPTYWAAARIEGFLGLAAMTPLEDQQLGGIIMWIPGALAYFAVLTVVFFLWLERRSPTDSPPYGTVNPDRARARTVES